uniref:MICOS complex subunit n=1 Tax=Xenopus tropicalis TaxID=8364 RepID=A0A803K8Z7_XENTR
MFKVRDGILCVVRLVSVPASLGFVSLHIHAATEDSTSPRKIIKVEELSLYSTPVQEAKYVEDKQTQLEEGVSWVRQAVAPYTSWCQDAYIKAKPKFETAVEHSKGTYEFLKDAPPGFYPRLGLIGFAGIVGLFLARGSRVKKVIYPLGFMGLGASLYYPQQAVTIAKDTSAVMYDWGLQGVVTLESLFKDSGKKKKGRKEEKPEEASEPSLKSDIVSTKETPEKGSTSEGSS